MRFTSALTVGVLALSANAQTASVPDPDEVAASVSSLMQSISSAVQGAADSVTSAVGSITSEAASATATSDATTTRSLTPAESSSAASAACLEACDPTDIACQAQCINIPNPDESAVNATTECVAKCPQGDGTEAETQKYIDCSQKCVNDYFLTSAASAGATATSGSGSGSATATATATPEPTTITSGSSTFVSTVTPSVTSGDSSSPTESSSDSSSTSEGGAISFAPIGSTGLIGLVAALFAL